MFKIFCPECGKELPSGSEFCRFCGAELEYIKNFLKETPAFDGNGSEKAEVSADGESARSKAAVWVKKGDVHAAAAKDSDENAIRCYTTAIGLDPSCRDAWNKKTGILHRLGRNMEAGICEENILHLEKGTKEKGVSSETYIGGISSPSLKRGSSKMGLDIAGSIGANMGGYGIYVTDRRLFIIKNQEQVYGHPMGPRLGGFIKEELFGGTVETRAKAIDERETIEIPKDEILMIELKKPMILSGFVAFTTLNGENPRLFIDHKRVYDSLRGLMLKFHPERTRIIT